MRSNLIEKIIWATDGSVSADNAVPYVAALATATHATVELVHIADSAKGSSADISDVLDEDSVVQAHLRTQAEFLRERGIESTVSIVPGRQKTAAYKLAEVAQDDDADLIVIGTRGHTAAASEVLGSVTQQLLLVTPCPVLSVPDHN
jgi:nucleotide-binding universal stress UspA family protein